jgi:hypothetical protein
LSDQPKTAPFVIDGTVVQLDAASLATVTGAPVYAFATDWPGFRAGVPYQFNATQLAALQADGAPVSQVA